MGAENQAAVPQWREFEKLAADIQRQLAPQARVESNVKLLGRRTGVERQIDILVEQNVGQYPIRIVIDCKDHKTPVDVNSVEAFMGLVADVGANKGAMVAACGFTSTAKQRAKDAGIDTYSLVDTRTTKWTTYVTIPCVIRDNLIEKLGFRFAAASFFQVESGNLRFMPVFRADGTLLDYLQNLVLDRWDAGDIPATPGQHNGIPVTKETCFVKTAGRLCKVAIEIDVLVAERLYFGQLPLQDVRGFRDDQSGDLLTNGFTTSPMDIAELEKSWGRIESIEQLSVKPVFGLRVKTTMPRHESPDHFK